MKFTSCQDGMCQVMTRLQARCLTDLSSVRGSQRLVCSPKCRHWLWVHQASYSLDTWGAVLLGVKWPEHVADHTPHQCALMTCKGTTLFYQICKMDNTDSNKSMKCITMLSSYIVIARLWLEHVTQMDITRLIANDFKLEVLTAGCILFFNKLRNIHRPQHFWLVHLMIVPRY